MVVGRRRSYHIDTSVSGCVLSTSFTSHIINFVMAVACTVTAFNCQHVQLPDDVSGEGVLHGGLVVCPLCRSVLVCNGCGWDGSKFDIRLYLTDDSGELYQSSTGTEDPPGQHFYYQISIFLHQPFK